MTIAVQNRSRVEWAPAITGAFGALAVAIVLGLFGAAFGRGGLAVLSGIWLVVTPLVAMFVGAAIAAVLADRRDAYATGIMVWCIGLVAGALLLVDTRAAVGLPGVREVTMSGAMLALAGLAAILGLIGAAIGSSFGILASRREGLSMPRTTVAGDHPAVESPAAAASPVTQPRPSSAGGESELRH